MRKVKDISLEEDSLFVDSNTIFLFLEDLRVYMRNLRAQSNVEKKKKKIKKIALKTRHFKVLIKYLDKDYDEIKKFLYLLLEARRSLLIFFEHCSKATRLFILQHMIR